MSGAAENTEDSTETRGPRALLKTLGPGLVTGAADDDPAGITTYSQAGAAFQYGLLWTVFLQIPLMIGVQYTCARIGLITGRDICRVLREHYPVWLLWIVMLLLAIANSVTAGADIAAVGAAFTMIAHVPMLVAVPMVSLGLISILLFGSYSIVERTLKWLCLALLAYLASGILAGAAWREVIRRTFIPGIRPSYAYLSLFVAVFGTTISPYMFIWQSGQELDEQHDRKRDSSQQRKGTSAEELRDARNDTAIGMAFSQLMGWFIIVAAGATLYPTGHRTIGTANEAAQALAPLGGGIGMVLFSLGIIGTGILAVPTLVGATAYAVSALACRPSGMARSLRESKTFSASIAAGVVIAAVFAMSGMSPVAMLLASASINGIFAAPMLVVVLLIANDSRIMGKQTNGWILNSLVAVAAVVMGGATLWLSAWWLKARV